MVRILFVCSGTLHVSQPQGTKFVTSKQCACLARGEEYVVTAHEQTQVIILSLEFRTEICEPDIFGAETADSPEVPADAVPVLALHPTVRWENTLDIKATKYLTTSIYFQLYYNRAQCYDVQTQTILSVGLSYTFQNKPKPK